MSARDDLLLLVHTRVFAGLVLLCLVLAVGAAGYMLIEGWSFADALYMSAITITTVGYKEVHPMSRTGEAFTVLLLFGGVGTAFYILTAMVAAIIEGDLGQVFGARRMRKTIERLQDHYIVCGYGRVGEETARELRDQKAPFVIIDKDPEAVQRARAQGHFVVEGDATEEAVLVEAGIARCRSLIAASDSDATNTYITLTARGLRSDVFIVARISTPAVESKLRQAGAGRVVSPYSIGGRRLALAAVQPIMTDFLDIAASDSQADRMLAEFVIDEASGLVGKQLSEALSGCRDVVALFLRDAEGRMNVGPGSQTILSLGDRLIVVGEENELRSIGAVLKA